jgi:hypothetical protein
MKKKTLGTIAGISCAVALLVVGLIAGFRVARQNSIQTAWNARTTAWNEELAVTPRNEAGYLARLQKIDVSATPLPFQHAWADYVHVWQDREARLIPGLLSLDQDKAAWRQVESVALDYGVKSSQ